MKTTVDQTFAALADPTRLDIVTRLSHGSASVSELAEPHAMSLRGVLKHVQVLEDAGLVRTVKHGRVRHCELQHDRIDSATRWLELVRQRWERRLDRLERYRRDGGTR
jgi:DNA-binding transcriptional ArsR family regulator